MFKGLRVVTPRDSMRISWVVVVERRRRVDWFYITLEDGRRTRVPGRSVSK
jgi:hypothetical protein